MKTPSVTIICTHYDQEMHATRALVIETVKANTELEHKLPLFAATCFAPVSACQRWAVKEGFEIDAIRYQ